MRNLHLHIKELLFYCTKLRPFMAFYKMQINARNATAHQILKNEVDLILPKFFTECRNERGIFGAIISGFIGLAFEAVKAISISTDMQRNKLMHLENPLIIPY